MYRPVVFVPASPTERWQETWTRLLTPLTLWLCVTLSIRYGYYGDCRMVLGPSSSRLMTASPLFVEHVQMRDDDRKGASLYGFSEKPELSGEYNWSASNYMIVGSYTRKGFSLWLNKGSTIRMTLVTQTSRLNQVEVVVIKGERQYERLQPKLTNSANATASSEPLKGKDAEFTVEEDNKYYIGVINTDSTSTILTMAVNVTSKIYDLTKATNTCSTLEGSCQLKLLFPNPQYFIITTPNNGDLGGWYLEISFVARVVTYIIILGVIVVIIFVVLRYLGAWDPENTNNMVAPAPREVSETAPLIPAKPIGFTYGTGEEEDAETGSSSSSSEDLYDAKLCVICYDEQRNCFFVPCGHCATCYDCAQRIVEGESKVCPICRRFIHKVRRLFTP